jgi:hypothetical protein
MKIKGRFFDVTNKDGNVAFLIRYDKEEDTFLLRFPDNDNDIGEIYYQNNLGKLIDELTSPRLDKKYIGCLSNLFKLAVTNRWLIRDSRGIVK